VSNKGFAANRVGVEIRQHSPGGWASKRVARGYPGSALWSFGRSPESAGSGGTKPDEEEGP